MDPEHLFRLKKGVAAWNTWRRANPDVVPDLTGADLTRYNGPGINLQKALLEQSSLVYAKLASSDLSGANLTEANVLRAGLDGADLTGANLSSANAAGVRLFEAKLTKADMYQANLSYAMLDRAELSDANMEAAILFAAHLREATLKRTVLRNAVLTKADLRDARLEECYVYGSSAWEVNLAGAQQSNLVITFSGEPVIRVDNLEVAQFIHLLLNNQKIRRVIDTITTKVVLLLGRFTPERKAVLDAIREKLRSRDYVPVLFDFEKPASRTRLETVSILARMARFVIADLTDAKSVLQELQEIVPNCPSVVIQCLLLASQDKPGMFDSFERRDSMLPIHRYLTEDALLAELGERVIAPAEAKAKEQTGRS